jgi:hypothetical protein
MGFEIFEKKQSLAMLAICLRAGFLFGLLSDPEDGGNTFSVD